MKNRFLNFLKKYRLCILLSIIMVIGIDLSTLYADLYESGNGGDMVRFDLGDLYLVFGLPLYSLIYGCLSYIRIKKIWLPQLILGVVGFLYLFRFDIKALVWGGTFIWSATLSAYPVIFSLIGAGITAFICKLIKSDKEHQN